MSPRKRRLAAQKPETSSKRYIVGTLLGLAAVVAFGAAVLTKEPRDG